MVNASENPNKELPPNNNNAITTNKVKNEVIEPLSRKDEAAYMNLAKINPKTTVDKLVKSIMQSFKTMVSIKNKLDKNPEAIKTTMQNIYNKVENHSRDMRMVRGF